MTGIITLPTNQGFVQNSKREKNRTESTDKAWTKPERESTDQAWTNPEREKTNNVRNISTSRCP